MRFLAGACIAALPLLAGCHLTEGSKSGSVPTAEVVIQGNTPGQVRAVATEVLQAQGYQAVSTSPRESVFDKAGTRWTNLAYGSWLGDDTALRVKLTFNVTGKTDCRVECRAYVVRDRGSAAEEELPVIKHKPYHQLLDDIAARFRGPAGSG